MLRCATAGPPTWRERGLRVLRRDRSSPVASANRHAPCSPAGARPASRRSLAEREQATEPPYGPPRRWQLRTAPAGGRARTVSTRCRRADELAHREHFSTLLELVDRVRVTTGPERGEGGMSLSTGDDVWQFDPVSKQGGPMRRYICSVLLLLHVSPAAAAGWWDGTALLNAYGKDDRMVLGYIYGTVDGDSRYALQAVLPAGVRDRSSMKSSGAT